MLSAVHYLHSNKIAHRDLKPENSTNPFTLIVNDILVLLDKYGNIKISDFGLARLTEESSMMTTLCGTPQYVAPEIINIGMPSMSCGGNFAHKIGSSASSMPGYCYQCDMWSLGVILYLLYALQTPSADL
jgi:serine/threonine protein kinase